jgi:hypothetical protein
MTEIREGHRYTTISKKYFSKYTMATLDLMNVKAYNKRIMHRITFFCQGNMISGSYE